MRRHALAILAVISLAALGVLLCGYFAYSTVEFDHESQTPEGIVRRGVGGTLMQGEIFVGYRRFPPRQPWGAEEATGWRVTKQAGFFRPDLQQSLWRFHVGPYAVPSEQGFAISFPNWCLILPCTIAPALWLRRHRRRTPRGFAVEPAKQVFE